MTTWYAQNGSQNLDAAWNGHPTMWNEAANGSGNWLTWLERSGNDVLEANGKGALAVNVDPAVARLQTLSGGGFTVTTASAAKMVHASLLAGTTTCLTWASGTSYALTLVGDSTGGGSANAVGLAHTTSCPTLNMTGNVCGGTAHGAHGISTAVNTGYAVYTNVLGNVTGGNPTGGANWAAGIYSTTTTQIIAVSGTIAVGGVQGPGIMCLPNQFSTIVSHMGSRIDGEWGTPAVGGNAFFCYQWQDRTHGYTCNFGYDGYSTTALKVPDYPAASNVWNGVPFDYDTRTGTKRASSIANCTAGNVAAGVVVDDVAGSFTHTADYVAKSDVVAASLVVTGHDNYAGGDHGNYPTTDTSRAEQLAEDRAAISARRFYVYPGADILGQNDGTLRASNIGVLAGTENLVAEDLRNGTIVDDVVGLLAASTFRIGG